MSVIEKKAIKLFNKNLEFFKEYDSRVYEKVMFLSEAIENKELEANYFLEYINGEFNIYDRLKNRFLYPEGVKAYNEYVKSTLTFKHDQGFNTLHEYAYSLRKDIEVTEDIEQIKQSLVPFTEYINDNFPTAKKDKEFIFINKFFVLGTLLGFHINKIKKFFDCKYMLITEPNLEIFRLSLFTFNYKKLSKTTRLYFSIGEEAVDFSRNCESFFTTNFTHNYFIKFYVVNDTYSSYLQSFANALQYQSPLNFDHMRMLEIVKRTATLIRDKYKFLNLKKFGLELADKPILILGSGPSLKYNIDWLEKNYKRFVIVSVAGCIPRLAKHHIIPDIIVSLEAYDQVKHRFDHIDMKLIENKIFFLSSMSHKTTLERFKKENVFIYEVLSNLKFESSIESLTATNVGEITTTIMLLMNTKNIYLLGIDAALDEVSGSSHDEVTNIGNKPGYDLNNVHSLNNKSTKIDMEDIVLTQGNFKDVVKTTRLFNNSVLSMARLMDLYKKENQHVFNLSNGAYFKKTIPLKVSDINIDKLKELDKDLLEQELKNIFNKHSMNRLTITEKYNIQSQINIVDILINAIDDFKKIKNIHNLHEYEVMRLSICNVLIESDIDNKSYLSKIFLTYLQLIEQYINYFFNDKKLENIEDKIQRINFIWCEESIKLLRNYREYLSIL